MKMYRLTLLLLAFAGLLSACSGGEDYREPKSEEDLSGLVLAASNGSYYQQKYEKRTDVQLFLTSSEADGVQAVRQGHADVYVSDEVMLTKADLKRLGMKKAFVGDECFDVAFAIRKGNTEIAGQLNAFLASAPLDDIINYWINGGPYVEEPAYTIPEGAKPLRCVCAVNIAPISYVGEGGKWQGLDADILRRFAHSVGRPFEMQFVDIGSAIMAINTGKADVFSGCLFITEERQKSMDFSAPYYKCHPGYFIVDHSRDTR
ncbi:MAG: transporter substrate-binding domain-containing protein, partial [Paludibacteraceae bacterium]|nr:transporter substrate-binding domain-containing protein [Paludibacteraceae bacterium]